MHIWMMTYFGYPVVLVVDKGPQFTGNEWNSLTHNAGIEVHSSGVESHNAIAPGERYHLYIRRVFRKVRTSMTQISDDLALTVAVNACNDTAVPNGLVPTLLVIGVFSKFPVRPQQLPENSDRMRAIGVARKEAGRLISKQRLDTTLGKLVPKVSDANIRIVASIDMIKPYCQNTLPKKSCARKSKRPLRAKCFCERERNLKLY